MSQEPESDGPTRRALLKTTCAGTVGAVGVAAGTSPALAGGESDERVLSFHSPSDVTVSYAFTVSGSVEPSHHVPPGVNVVSATIDVGTEIDGTDVTGAVRGGVDSYDYAGGITAFAVTSGNCEALSVWIDDEPVDPCELDNSLPDPDAGEDAEAVTACERIDASGTYVFDGDLTSDASGPCLEVRADDVVLDGHGHRLGGGCNDPDSVGIRVRGSNVTVKNVVVEGWGTCVRVEGDGCTVRDSELRNAGCPAGTALAVEDADEATIRANQIAGSEIGIALSGASGTTLRANEVGTVGSAGLSAHDAPEITAVGNAIAGITFGAVVQSSPRSAFTDNEFVSGDEDGIAVLRSDGVALSDNDASRASGSGIYLSESSACVLSGNAANENEEAGITLVEADENRVVDNETRNNGIVATGDSGGIVLQNADDNDLRRNLVCGNAGPNQIRIDSESTENTVENNDVSETCS